MIIANASTKDSIWVEDYIIYIAQHENINVNMFLGIAKAESNFNPTAKNPVGTASGVMQFLDSSFRNYCINKYQLTDTMEEKNNPAIQINCAAYMLQEPKGWMHWLASKDTWGKYKELLK